MYLDDIIIFSPTYEAHLEDLREVFHRLRAANLILKPSKCHFFKNKIKYLGHVISEKGIETDVDKIKAITDMKPPRNVSEVRSFLGMCSYYRRFIPNFARVCNPLFKLIQKNTQFKWTTNEEKSFNKLKELFISAPILVHDKMVLFSSCLLLCGVVCILVLRLDRRNRD